MQNPFENVRGTSYSDENEKRNFMKNKKKNIK